MSDSIQTIIIEPGLGRTILLIVAHADDPVLFLGGTIALWANAGWRVVCVRVTDDRWDSLALSEADTIAANTAEFRASSKILGIDVIDDWHYATDTLADISEVTLRDRCIRAVRTYRPYALVTFDPYSLYGEDNQDHLMVARAVDESFWTSQFDKHHPEHLAEGLEPHGCFERWYFGRPVGRVTDVIDISATLNRKIDAALCHLTMLKNFVNQLRMQAHTGGWTVPIFDDAAAHDLRPLMELFLTGQASATGQRHGLTAAEEFRVVRFGGLSGMLPNYGTKAD